MSFLKVWLLKLLSVLRSPWEKIVQEQETDKPKWSKKFLKVFLVHLPRIQNCSSDWNKIFTEYLKKNLNLIKASFAWTYPVRTIVTDDKMEPVLHIFNEIFLSSIWLLCLEHLQFLSSWGYKIFKKESYLWYLWYLTESRISLFIKPCVDDTVYLLLKCFFHGKEQKKNLIFGVLNMTPRNYAG